MVEVRWTVQSIEDIKSIAEFIEKESSKYADSQVDSFFTHSEILEVFPLAGRIIPETNIKTLRELIVGNYRLVYEIINVGSSSVTVLAKVYRMTGDAEFVELIFSTLATLVAIDGTKRPCDVESYLNSDFKLKELRETKRWKDAASLVATLKLQRKTCPCPE